MSSYSSLLEERAFISGEWWAGSERFAVYNPCDASLFAAVADVGESLVPTLLAAAAAALPSWDRLGGQQRGAILRAWAEGIGENTDQLAQLITREQGKPLREAQGEVASAIAYIRWYIAEAERLGSSEIPGLGDKGRSELRQAPVGVVLAITPWNFPLLGVVVKVAAAMAAGCAVMVKPSEETPLSALAVARVAQAAGVPAGVLQVITTSRPKEISACLLADSRVRLLSFTGSTAVGKGLLAQMGVRRALLELGGNAPLIVCEDADLEEAITAAIKAKFYNNGQICLGINRFLIHENVYSTFREKFIAKMRALRLGSGLDPENDLGPLSNEKALNKIKALVATTLDEGGLRAAGGEGSTLGGWFFQPTLLENLDSSMTIFREEIFGPIACFYKFRDNEEALQLANATTAGLAAYVFSADCAVQEKFAEQLEFAMVGINTCHLARGPQIPFGGIKDSGMGREGGVGCLEEYCEQRLRIYLSGIYA
jgi:succinate-semialdehyde dehydrogenase/glutarate-semialdehyde dehydrogenase